MINEKKRSDLNNLKIIVGERQVTMSPVGSPPDGFIQILLNVQS